MTLGIGTVRSPTGWRQEDEALLSRLEDEVSVELLWRHQAPKGAVSLPERAAGLVREIRKLEGGEQAIAAARGGDPTGLFPFLLVEPLSQRSPELTHQIAIYFDRLSEALQTEALRVGDADRDSGALREAALRTKVRSLAAWIALSTERSYLASSARRILGTDLTASDIDAAVANVANACFEELGQTARSGARKLEPTAHAALAALAQADEACRIAGSEAKLRTTIVRRAESIRALAIDEALVPILDGLAGAKLRDDGERLFPELFAGIARVWYWSGGDEAVERFAVDELNAIAWSIYRASRWDALRALLAPCAALYDSLASRIERDPKRHLAYAAKCAQVFVFRSECETDRTRELALAERALVLCPSHRNGRLIMAHLCCDSAIRRLNVPFYPSATEVDRAKSEIKRATELFPQSKRLPEAQAKLKEIIERSGGVYLP